MAKRAKKTTTESPGIQELIWVDPRTLDDNPHNWRKHPARQMRALGASIKANGWADALKWNKNTGRLIDGHGRKQVAIQAGEQAVPVLVGWWTEEQERNLLATMDPLAAMAETDAGAFQALLDMDRETVETFSTLDSTEKQVLQDLNNNLENYAFNVSIGKAERTMLPKAPPTKPLESLPANDQLVTVSFNENVHFSSSNPWGIPDLLDEGFADLEITGTWDRTPGSLDPGAWFCYSARPFPKEREGGVLGFFTEDHRFNRSWSDRIQFGEELYQEEWAAVVGPDFSVYDDAPYAERLWAVYRNRWCLRFWQEINVPIIPTVQSLDDFCISTLPRGLPLLATQCRKINRAGRQYWKSYQKELRTIADTLQPQRLVIYGGIELEKYLGDITGHVECVFVDSYMTKRRHTLKEQRDG